MFPSLTSMENRCCLRLPFAALILPLVGFIIEGSVVNLRALGAAESIAAALGDDYGPLSCRDAAEERPFHVGLADAQWSEG